jgi:hypothetical protein
MATSFRTRLGLAAIVAICGGLSCESPVAPKPNTPIGLRVWTEVAPTSLSIGDSTATLRIRVYVENPAGDTLRVRSGGPPYIFTSDPAQSQGLEESFRIASATDFLNAGPDTDYWGDSVYVFPPHDMEYTEAVVSIRQWRAGGWPLIPGPLRVRSWFNGREGSSASFQLVP